MKVKVNYNNHLLIKIIVHTGIFWFTSFTTLYAQYENIWVFGRSKAGIDFNSGNPVPVQTNFGVYPEGYNKSAWGEGCASVCDASGNLLFYTEGFFIWDRNGNVMPNGRELTPTFGVQISYTPTSSTSQGVVIIPIPEDEDKYYVFSLTGYEYYKESLGHLYYSVVDMSLNGGLGDVIPNQKMIAVDSFLVEKMTATFGDRCNVWLLTSSVDSIIPRFKAYEITAEGFNPNPVISNTGLGRNFSPFGTMTASPDRKKLIATQSITAGGSNGAALFHFDPATGMVDSPLQLLPYWGGYGAAFSPDNSKVYVMRALMRSGLISPIHDIYQYDLSSDNAVDILASETLIAEDVPFSHLKLAPDNKIYFLADKEYLGRIEAPNNRGIACNYQEKAVRMLPDHQLHAGLPNVVTVIPRNTYITTQNIQAPCWANINKVVLVPNVDTDGWDHQWNDGTEQGGRTIDQPGTYWLSYYTPPCNYHIDTFHVSFPYGVLPDIHVQNSCNKGNNGKAWASTYEGDTVTYHYLWTDSKGDTLSYADTLKIIYPGTYDVYISTANCDTLLTVSVPDEKHSVSFLADSIICYGTEVQFVNNSDSIYTDFEWGFGDNSNTTLYEPRYTYRQPGTYEVKLLGTGKICKDSMIKTIIVDSIFEGKFLKEKDSICMGESILLYPQLNPTIVTLNWDFGDGTAMTTVNESSIEHNYDLSGEMYIRLNTIYRSCPGTLFSDLVYAEALPYIDLGSDSGLCLQGSPVYLRNLRSTSSDNYHYSWSTGDTTPYLKVTYPGTYRLTLSTKRLSCSSMESINISKDCYIDIPNAFTPNGDGINDYFFPRQLLSGNVSGFYMQVFNRWGQLIFETTHANGRGWDGKFNGQDQPGGVYIYWINVTFDNNRQEQYKGNVSLIR